MSQPSGVFYQRVLCSEDGGRQLVWSPPMLHGFDVPEMYYIYDAETQNLLLKLDAGTSSVMLGDEYHGRTLTVKAVYPDEELPPASPPQAIYVLRQEDLPHRDPVSGGLALPPWFSTEPLRTRQKLLASTWFLEWWGTAVALNVNPLRLRQDNKGQSHKIIWRTDERVLFHGDEEGRPPEEIFRYGMAPPDVAGKLVMRAGSHIGAFESFSYQFGTIVGYATSDSTADKKQGYVYLVHTRGGVCVDESLIDGGPNEYEVAFPGGVTPRYIMGAFIFPAYRKTFEPPSMFDWAPSGPLKAPEQGVIIIFAQPGDEDQTLILHPLDGGEVIKIGEEPWRLISATGKYRAERLKSRPGGYYSWFVNGALQMDNGMPTQNLVITLPDAAVNGMLVIEWANQV